jgi:hypothetical protein
VRPRFPGQQTVRIELREFDGSDDWVEVRAGLRFEDIAAMVDARQRQGDVAFSRELLRRSIVAWSFRVSPDDPEPVRVTPGTIEQLDAGLALWLVAQLNSLYDLGKAAAATTNTTSSSAEP